MKTRTMLFIAIATAVASRVSAQPIFRCGTPEVSQTVPANDNYKIRSDEVFIPVVVHVVYASDGSGNISDAQIQAQIDTLSAVFARAGTRYRFYLAAIGRIQNDSWHFAYIGSQEVLDMTNALAINPANAFNIYVINGGALLGWIVRWPWEEPETSLQHGIIIHYGSVPGGNIPDFNWGYTAVHEAGHYLGLYHTFQYGCTEPGDEVNDTPFHLMNTGCPYPNPDTCPQDGLDPIHNYMNYTNDPCYSEFTFLQGERIDAIVGEYKPNLGGTRIILSGNKTISADYTFYTELEISTGSVLSFSNGASLIVHGRLLAQGTGANRIILKSAGGTWNGIVLNNADNSAISYCDLQNGNASQSGIKLMSADNVSISNCTISGFYYGIYAYEATSTTIQNVTISAGNSGIQLINGGPASISCVTAWAPTVGIRSYHQSGLSVSSSVSNYAQYGMIVDRVAGQLTSNTMNNCSLMGLYLVDADATITGSTFDSNARGIYCNYYSDPTIRSSTIRHCYPNSGIVNSSNSIPNLGTTANRGNNYIYLNVPYNVQSYYPGSIYAQYNYWEEDCWDPRFYGTVVWEPSYCGQYVTSKEPFDSEKSHRFFKTTSKFGELSSADLAKGSEWDGPIEGLESAYADYSDGRYAEAFTAFDLLVKEVPNTATAKRALAFAMKCLAKMEREFEKTSYLQKIANDLRGTGVELLARHFLASEYIKKRDYAKAQDLLTQVAEAKGSEEAKFALYDLLMLSVHVQRDYESAAQYLSNLRQNYPNDIETELAGIELLQVRPGDAKPLAQADGRTEMDLQGYPNPFNPSTIIRFALPIAGDVSVVVYDILGRGVKVLLSGYRTAGEHEVIFDASSLPSGLYFCRLQSDSKMLVRKILLVR